MKAIKIKGLCATAESREKCEQCGNFVDCNTIYNIIGLLIAAKHKAIFSIMAKKEISLIKG